MDGEVPPEAGVGLQGQQAELPAGQGLPAGRGDLPADQREPGDREDDGGGAGVQGAGHGVHGVQRERRAQQGGDPGDLDAIAGQGPGHCAEGDHHGRGGRHRGQGGPPAAAGADQAEPEQVHLHLQRAGAEAEEPGAEGGGPEVPQAGGAQHPGEARVHRGARGGGGAGARAGEDCAAGGRGPAVRDQPGADGGGGQGAGGRGGQGGGEGRLRAHAGNIPREGRGQEHGPLLQGCGHGPPHGARELPGIGPQVDRGTVRVRPPHQSQRNCERRQAGDAGLPVRARTGLLLRRVRGPQQARRQDRLPRLARQQQQAPQNRQAAPHPQLPRPGAPRLLRGLRPLFYAEFMRQNYAVCRERQLRGLRALPAAAGARAGRHRRAPGARRCQVPREGQAQAVLCAARVEVRLRAGVI